MLSAAEIRTLAWVVERSAIARDVERGMNSYNECRYCGEYQYWDEKISDLEHEKDCVYLIAQKALKESA
jgi:hypothetical protein